MEPADVDLLNDEALALIRWATGRQEASLRAAGETGEAERHGAWGLMAEAELRRRSAGSAASDLDASVAVAA